MSAAHILVVDDEADIRGLLKEILSEEGYDVDVAGDAGQARASRARQLPDLVLLDIWMPDTDGITLLREWSGQSAESSCPVVMMSGHGTVETAVEATRREAFARFIHDASPRAARPFVTLISSTLRGDGAEQVLFGTESNGQVAPGVLERAGAGTLFVNELADLPAQAQRALLGTLESGQFTRVGGTTPVMFKARLLSSARPGIETR